ncbi:MAG: preprotein translocase subunit SecE [Alphaproteobacteria bacterium]|nr:preprotein translocase subunit SecE [Alphaproteobacteria bacterium]
MATEQTTEQSQKPKTGLAEFARETKREIAKVTWPTRREITLTTVMVVGFALVTGLFFLVVDTALGHVVSTLLGMTS